MFQVNPLLARQRIHMKNQALFSSKDKSKNLKCRLLQFLFGALRVKEWSCKNSKNVVLLKMEQFGLTMQQCIKEIQME